ncbi:MAG TPA: hypothetical protein G4O00_01230 [Thermoflexia bacterium]|nr:hypothetical protein [Thermoflexia bacterium]
MEKRWFVTMGVVLLSMAALLALMGLVEGLAMTITYPVLAAPPEVVTPTVTGVDPDSGPNDIDTSIIIAGTNFTAELSGTLVITAPTAYLGDTALEDVVWVSSTTLSATVQWGLDPGVYTLTVVNPDGGTGSLADAFTVTQGIGVWTTGGPYGGRAQFVILHPEDSATVYAASQWAGLFVSEDAGGNWQPILADDWPTRLVFDAESSNVMYYSGDSASFHRTDDGGQTWGLLPELFHAQDGCFTVYAAAHPTDAGVIYAGTGSCAGIPVLPGEGGVFYSQDYGANWVTRTQGLTDTDLVDIIFHPTNPLTMVVATRGGSIFLTTDGGLNWDLQSTIPDDLRRIYINPYGANEAWALPEIGYQPPVRPYLYKSADLITWEVITLTDDLLPSGGIWSLTFAPGEIWAAGGWGYFSDDGGASWSGVITISQQVGGVRSFAIDPSDSNVIYAADSDRGVLKSSDGGTTWREINEGLAALTTRDVAAAPGQPDQVYVETYEYGLLRSASGGYAWQELGVRKGGPPKGKIVATDPFIPTRVYYPVGCSGDGPCIWYSTDEGSSWHEVTMTIPATYTGWTGELTAIAAHPLVSGTLLAGAGFYQERSDFDEGIEPCGIYRSDDHGATWQFLGPTAPISEVLDIAFDAVDPDLIYAATNGGGLWRSTDGGANWMRVPISNTLSPVVVEAVVTHLDVPGKVYVRTYSYAESPNPEPELWVSEDAGDTWQQLTYVFLGVDLLISPPVPGYPPYTLYTGCETGLCRSTDDGQTWEPVGGAPRPEILAAASDGERTVIYLGSPGGLVTSIEQQSALSLNTIPGRDSVLGSGVYRLAMRLPNHWVYLPLVLRGYIP